MIASLVPLTLAASLSPGCYSLATAKATGAAVQREDAVATDCEAADHRRPVYFDPATETLIARENLDAGTYLGRIYFPPERLVRNGDKVRLVVRIGHTAIERDAVALQPAKAGSPYFVRTGDGQVLVAPAISKAPSSER